MNCIADRKIRAGGNNKPQWRLSQNQLQLTVSGILFDIVDTCCDELPWDKDFNEDFTKMGIGSMEFKDLLVRFQPPVDILRTWFSFKSKFDTYPTGESVDIAFKSTLLEGGFVQAAKPPSDQSFEEWLDFMKSISVDGNKQPQTNQKGIKTPGLPSFLGLTSTSASEYHFAVLRQTKGKCFFSTAKGYFGLADARVLPGDRVALFPGLDVPFILRSTGQYFTLITFGYVNGIMFSEAWDKNIGVEDITII
jgi:hypothetical protein